MATSGKPLPEAERKRIVNLRSLGRSLRVIARSVGVSLRTVQKYLREPR
jgi:IS30 family transposase